MSVELHRGERIQPDPYRPPGERIGARHRAAPDAGRTREKKMMPLRQLVDEALRRETHPGNELCLVDHGWEFERPDPPIGIGLGAPAHIGLGERLTARMDTLTGQMSGETRLAHRPTPLEDRHLLGGSRDEDLFHGTVTTGVLRHGILLRRVQENSCTRRKRILDGLLGADFSEPRLSRARRRDARRRRPRRRRRRARPAGRGRAALRPWCRPAR